MILSNLSVPLLGMADTAVVGHLEAPFYLGAVAVGAQVFNFLFLGLNFLRMGTTGVTAQALGRGATGELRGALGQSLLLAGVLAAGLLVLQWPIRELTVWLMGPSGDVGAHARVYFDIRIWAAPFALANLALVGWFLGLGNARVPLAVMVTINASNILLDIGFVIGLGMDVDGVALASVLGEVLGLGIALTLARRELARRPGTWSRSSLLDGGKLRRLVGINLNIFVRTACLIGSFFFFTSQGARMGDVVLAANAVLLNFQNILSYGLDGFAHAAEALVGRAVGRGKRHELQAAVRATLLWSVGLALAYTVVYAVAGGPLVRLLTDLPDVRATAMAHLPWVLAAPLISVWAFLYDGVFIGATRAREMRNIMLVATLGCYLPAWWLLQGWGNHGLWAALMVFLAARGVGMALVYRRLLSRAAFGK